MTLPENHVVFARELGQASREAEDRGDYASALQLNAQAIDAFLEAGDAPGLLVAYRGRAFLLFRIGNFEEALAQLARALSFALQLDAEFVWDTLSQIVGVGGYFANERPADLLPLGAATQLAIDHVRAERGEFPLDMQGPVEIASSLANIYSALGLLHAHAGKIELLPEENVERLVADVMTQAWAVDALSRQAWGLVLMAKPWLLARGFAVED